jgi:hypothetical protein
MQEHAHSLSIFHQSSSTTARRTFNQIYLLVLRINYFVALTHDI